MGLLDAWSQRALQRRQGRVEFLGEYSGAVEDPLKRDLILEFATRPVIRRAYLADIRFDTAEEPTPALCILSDQGEDRSLVIRIGEICRRRHAADALPEVVFLTDAQDLEVARLCRPFYARAT